MLFFGIKKTVRLNKKKTKEFPLGNSLVHTVIGDHPTFCVNLQGGV